MVDRWILVVHADDGERQPLVDKLSRSCARYRVANFPDTTAAERWLSSEPGRRLVLALVQIPRPSNRRDTEPHRTLLGYIREQAPRAKVVAMSRESPPGDIAQLFNKSLVDGYIDVGWGENHIQKEVDRLLVLRSRTRPLIVFVDDDGHYLREFGERLAAWFPDCQVVARETAAEAISWLKKRQRGSVELAVVDVVLQEDDGCLALLRYVKETFPNARRIAITGQEAKRLLGVMINEDLVDRFIDKGWSQAEIRSDIDGLLRASRATPAHAQILEAMHDWCDKSPLARPHELAYFPGEAPRTMSEVAHEIAEGTPFGRRQERIIYKLALGIWNPHRSEGRALEEEQP